jgi:hypothetical protein
MLFDDNVFINCPYDAEYLPLLRPLVFTVLYAGLNPRLASERLNSGETRISKIVELIRELQIAELIRYMREWLIATTPNSA